MEEMTWHQMWVGMQESNNNWKEGWMSKAVVQVYEVTHRNQTDLPTEEGEEWGPEEGHGVCLLFYSL